MRRCFWGLISAALLFFCACTTEFQEKTINTPQVGETITITAYSDNSVQTKTGVIDNGNGGKSVVWKAGNAISLFFNQGDNGGNRFTTNTNGPIAEFTGTISAVSGDLSGVGGSAFFWGLYPYNTTASCDGSTITTTLPANQSAYQGDVADDLLVTVGRSENLAIHFKNTCAIIGFTLSQENISKVTFSGNNEEYVAGEFMASFDGSNNLNITPTAYAVKAIEITPAESSTFATGATYYFAILPQNFESGYKLTFTRDDDYTAAYERTSSFNFAISTFYTMTNKDSGLSFMNNNAVIFADENFQNYCLEEFDGNEDGEISITEAELVTDITICTDYIKSLGGLEYFTNLKTLSCTGSLLSTKSAADTYAGQLETLDIEQNTLLETLDCHGNQLETLDVSNNPNLNTLVCTGNPIETINLYPGQVIANYEAPDDAEIVYDWNNVIGPMSFPDESFRSFVFANFDTDSDGILSTTECAAVDSIDCSVVGPDNRIQSLVGIEFFANLSILKCSNEALATLDVSCNSKLKVLDCNNNQLTELNVSQNSLLETLWCGHNQLAALELGANTALKELSCFDNQLSELNISANKSLTHLVCAANQLTVLDIRDNKALTYLDCGDNQLTFLDVRANTQLSTFLGCYNNRLTALDVSVNYLLIELACYNNELTSLDVSNNIVLENLSCKDNPFLSEIWLRAGQELSWFEYDTDVATIKYKDASGSEIITFTDANVEAICVANWDTNNDGKLSCSEANAVTSLGLVFRDNTEVTRFDELQFFTGLSSINVEAFCNCSNLVSITLPNNLTAIGDSAFSSCSAMTEIDIPESVSSIGVYSFSNSGLVSIALPNGLASINDDAFSNCTSLNSVTIPQSVTTIGHYAFSGCIGLTNVDIPENMTLIGNYAFAGCSGLTKITVMATNPPTLGTNSTSNVFNNTNSCPILVPYSSVDIYKTASRWSSYSDRIRAIPGSSGTPLEFFNPNNYLVYRGNKTEYTIGRDYYSIQSHMPGITGAKIEVKFQLSEGMNKTIACDNTGSDHSYSQLRIEDGHLIWSNWDDDDDKCFGFSLSLGDYNISETDLIVLEYDSVNSFISVNNHASMCSHGTMSFEHLFAKYYSESDEGRRTAYTGVPDGSKLYYVKTWNENDNLSYIGFATTATNPATGNVEYCWLSYYPETGLISYDFANDAANQGAYGGFTYEN